MATSPDLFKSSFTSIQKAILDDPEAAVQTTKDAEHPEKQPVTTLRITYLCLHCESICSAEELKSHAERTHCFCEY